MNRVAVFAAILMLTCVTPALAASDCLYLGVPSSDGALICQAGTISQCKAGQWQPTGKSCAANTVVTPAPVSAPPAATAPYLLHVLTASYSAGDTGQDEAYAVRALCEGKPSCSFVGDLKFLKGDPAPGLRGRFSIIYECTTGFRTQDAQHLIFDKNATIALSCR